MLQPLDKNDKDKLQHRLPELDILNQLPVSLVVLSAQGQVLWVNAAASVLFGVDITHRPWIEVIRDAFSPTVDDGLQVSMVNGRKVNIYLSPLDALPGELVTITDVTETRVYEQAKEHQKHLISIGTMTAQLAHQIRTPLAAATLYSSHLATQSDLGAQQTRWIQRIQDCHASIEQQIKDLLLFARGQNIEPEWLDTALWFSQLAQRLQVFIEQNPLIEFIIKNQLHSKQLMIHGESLIGVIVNLVMNAMEASASKIEVLLSSNEASDLSISVRDNGKGMSEVCKAQVFDPFYTTRAKGTGLGMAVVLAVVKAHKGEISLESIEHKGTVIDIDIKGQSL